MSISPQVRETGAMEDEYGIRIVFGVDHGSVTVNNIQVFAADDEFARLYFAAIEAAKAQAGVPCTGACCIGAQTEMPPHSHPTDHDADTCTICFPPAILRSDDTEGEQR